MVASFSSIGDPYIPQSCGAPRGGLRDAGEALVSSSVTDGIRVEVRSTFQPERSEPDRRRWLFSYTVRIANEGEATAQLRSRHWIIMDAEGNREEVVGDGVVGHQPRLEPGQQFEYTSYCVLKTPHGSMQGSYHMVRDDGTSFAARIAPFPLVVPGAAN
jgi:ApaG protein